MFPYLAILGLATYLFFSAPRKTNFLVALFLLSFILIAGLRDMIGGFDVYIYAEVYEVLKGPQLYLYTPFEKGFLTYYYALQTISTKREFLFFMSALIMTLLHYYSFKKHSINIGMSLFIYFCKFFLFSFVYLRQGLAMGIIWLSIFYIIEKRYYLTASILFLAFFFHKSSIVFIPFLLIAHKKFTLNQLGLMAVGIIFISITPVGSFLTSFLAEASDSNKLSAYAKKSGGVNFFYLIEGGIGLYLASNFYKYFYLNKETTVIFNGFFMYCIVILAGLTNATFIRFSWYYFIFVVLALPYIYYFYKIKNASFQANFKMLLFSYYTAIFLRLMIVYDGGDFMPYKTFFQDFDRNGMWEYMEYRNRYNLE